MIADRSAFGRGRHLVILAGGRSRRMGSEKALLEVDGRSLLRRLVESLAPQTSRVAVSVSNRGPSEALAREIERVRRSSGLPVDIVFDGERGSEGPLCGIHAGLGIVEEGAAAFFVSVDTASIDHDLIDSMFELVKARDASGVVPVWRGREQPTHAVYRGALRGRVRRLLCQGERRASSMAGLEGVIRLEIEEDRGARAFAPLNSPADLAALRIREGA